MLFFLFLMNFLMILASLSMSELFINIQVVCLEMCAYEGEQQTQLSDSVLI